MNEPKTQPVKDFLEELIENQDQPVETQTSSPQVQSKKPLEENVNERRTRNVMNSSVPYSIVKPLVDGMVANGLSLAEISAMLGASENYISTAEKANRISNIGAGAIKLLHENLRLKVLSKNAVDRADLVQVYAAVYGKPGMMDVQRMLHKMLEE